MSIDLDSKKVLFVCGLSVTYVSARFSIEYAHYGFLSGILGMYVYDTIIKPNLRSK